MDTFEAFALGESNRGKPLMVFDWDKAARIIKERGAKSAGAGLRGDWEWTGGPILRNGKPISKEETYTFLASTWAVPELKVDGEVIACFKMESECPGWDSDTFWPESAIQILQSTD